MYVRLLRFVSIVGESKLIKLVLLAVVFDIVFGFLRAIKERRLNSSTGIDGCIRKAAMVLSIVFLVMIDLMVNINLIEFIPLDVRKWIGIGNVGIADFFALLYISYEAVSICKNMTLCGLPVKKIWVTVRKVLVKYTDELPEVSDSSVPIDCVGKDGD